MYTRQDIITPIILYNKGSKEAIEFRSKLGFKQHYIIMSKEQSLTTKIIKSFPKEKVLLQYSVSGKRTDMYFSKRKLV